MTSTKRINTARKQKKSRISTVVPERVEKEPFSFQKFHRIDEINAWLHQLASANAASGRAILVEAGRSSEGRSIRGLCLFPGADKPRVLVEAGMHAQEWITTSTACWFIHHLLDDGGVAAKLGCSGPDRPSTEKSVEPDPAWRTLAEHFEWHVFPNVNPDGYEYSFLTNRGWRKTRSKGLVCHGVDGNRNWAFGWNPGTSVTRHPCARNYPGRAPFSEPETRCLAEYVAALRPGARLKAFISLHSSKQMILFPWGCSEERSSHHDQLMEIGTKAANALERVHGTKFAVGPISTTIYLAPGNSVDWVYSRGVKYAFAMELRNPVSTERYVRASEIIATAEETFAAVLAMLEEAASSEK